MTHASDRSTKIRNNIKLVDLYGTVVEVLMLIGEGGRRKLTTGWLSQLYKVSKGQNRNGIGFIVKRTTATLSYPGLRSIYWLTSNRAQILSTCNYIRITVDKIVLHIPCGTLCKKTMYSTLRVLCVENAMPSHCCSMFTQTVITSVLQQLMKAMCCKMENRGFDYLSA
ncbi:hypothetical protein L9F63_006316, partial [Diploptera punctata]